MSIVGGVRYHGGHHLLLFEDLHGTHDIPHMYHNICHGTQITKDDFPYGTEHPPQYTCIIISAHGTEYP